MCFNFGFLLLIFTESLAFTTLGNTMQKSIMNDITRDEIIALMFRENKYSKEVISGVPAAQFDCSSSSMNDPRLSPISVTGLLDCDEARARVCEWMYQVSKSADLSLG